MVAEGDGKELNKKMAAKRWGTDFMVKKWGVKNNCSRFASLQARDGKDFNAEARRGDGATQPMP